MKSSHDNYKKLNRLIEDLGRLINWGAVGFTFRVPFVEEKTPLLTIKSPEDRARRVVAIQAMEQDIGDIIHHGDSVFFNHIHKEDIDREMLAVLEEMLDPEEYESLIIYLAEDEE